MRKIAPQIHRSWNVQLTSRTNIRDCGDKSGEEIALSGGAVSVSGRRCTEGGDQGGDQARGETESCDNIEEVLECRTCLSVLHPIFPQDIYPDNPKQISKVILLVEH